MYDIINFMPKGIDSTNKVFKILLINGPNLNLLGKREPIQYGHITLSNLILELNKTAQSLNLILEHFQSNSECEIINRIHCSYNNTNFIVINPAAFTHTSIALRDALLAVNIAFIEIHLSNIFKREKFRHCSYFSDIAIGMICGFGVDGYHMSLHMARKHLSIYS